MTLPWPAVIAIEYAVFGWFFASDLRAGTGGETVPDGEAVDLPVFTLTVVAIPLIGFVAASAAG